MTRAEYANKKCGLNISLRASNADPKNATYVNVDDISSTDVIVHQEVELWFHIRYAASLPESFWGTFVVFLPVEEQCAQFTFLEEFVRSVSLCFCLLCRSTMNDGNG